MAKRGARPSHVASGTRRLSSPLSLGARKVTVSHCRHVRPCHRFCFLLEHTQYRGPAVAWRSIERWAVCRRRGATAGGLSRQEAVAMTISLTSTVLRYGIAPADKSLSYAIFEAPWMILTWICLYLPPVFPIWPITLVAWFWCATPIRRRRRKHHGNQPLDFLLQVLSVHHHRAGRVHAFQLHRLFQGSHAPAYRTMPMPLPAPARHPANVR